MSSCSGRTGWSAPIPFFLGLGSRYSYLAAIRISSIEKRTNLRFEWLPLASATLIRRANRGRSPFDAKTPSGQYREAYRNRDAALWAAYLDAPYRDPVPFACAAEDPAEACWALAPEGLVEAMARAILDAVFVRGERVDRPRLLALARGLGVGDLEARLGQGAAAARHEATLARALDVAAFGVPTFVVDGEPIWGADRLPLVEWRATGVRPATDAAVEAAST